jgi:thiol-disulfide isomerase/thioredoxin
MNDTNRTIHAPKKLLVSLAFVCLTATLGFAQSAPAEPAFRSTMRRINACAEAGDGQKLFELFTSTKPASRADNLEFANAVNKHIDWIAGTLGPAKALNALELAEKEIKLPDPNEIAKDAIAAAGDKSLSKEARAVYDLRNTSSMTPEARLAFYADAFGVKIDWVTCELVRKRAKLLDAEDKREKALEVLKKYSETPNLSKNSKEQCQNSITLLKRVGLPATALKVDKALGNFSGLDSLKGKVVFLDYYAHWCHPCLAAVPGVITMYDKLHSKGLEVVGVTGIYGFFGEEQKITPEVELAKLQGLIKEKGMPWPTVVGPNTNNAAYGVSGIPHVVLIDRKGIVRHMYVGHTAAQAALIHRQVEALVNE